MWLYLLLNRVVSLLWAEDRHAERVSWYRQAVANAKRRDYFGIAKSASLRPVAMGAVFFSAGLLDVYSKIFQIYPNMPSIQPKRISLYTWIYLEYSILVGGFKHCLFSISYMGCHPNPIDEVHHVSRWFGGTTNQHYYW